MTSQKQQQEMTSLLEDSGWKVKKLVIVDKDWWVLQNEYRYLQTTAPSKDDSGPCWSFVSFRQMQTLTIYSAPSYWRSKTKFVFRNQGAFTLRQNWTIGQG